MRNSALSFVTPFPSSSSSSSDDDCCSVNSTVDTTLPKAALAAVTSASTTTTVRKARPHVHFDLDENQVYSNNEHGIISREDIRDAMWYSSAELKRFRANYKSEAKSFRIIESEQQQEEEENDDAWNSYHNVLERVYATCSFYSVEVPQPTVDDMDDQHFRTWIKVTDSRWGLERLCVRSIAQDKQSRRQHLYDTMEVLQEHPTLSSAESLAEACQNISRGSRYFATLLGQAQAQAVYR